MSATKTTFTQSINSYNKCGPIEVFRYCLVYINIILKEARIMGMKQ